MTIEQQETLRGLQIAIQTEIDGKEYYLKASQISDNKLGKELFQSLAVEEDIHRQKFEEIYNVLRSKRTWPKVDFQSDRGKRLATIFAKGIEEMGSNVKAPASEIDAVQKAMDMENKTYDFYQNQSQKATYDAERDYYQALAAEERGHYLSLHDYHEYLSDPAGWLVNQEHPSLDGG
jgi:rubrerythrin